MTAAADATSRVLAPGVRLAGKLKLLHSIAEGGMGAVWLAQNVTTGAQVAVKVLLGERREDLQAVERFRHEAKLGASLSHRNITRVYDLLEDDDGSLVLVMELLDGETLRNYYQTNGPLPTREAVAIMVSVLSGLQHAHEQGVIHRDLKPSNIVLHVDSDGQVTPKLIDFGIAKATDTSIKTRTGDAIGTPSYMSPEQVRAAVLDGRSDLFSAAVVLYEVIVGHGPFPGPTAPAMLSQVLEMDVDPDPRIDPRVWIEMQRALSKQAYERHGSARELAAALCKAVGESENALRESLRREAPPVPRIHPFEEPGSTDPKINATVRIEGRPEEPPSSQRPRSWPLKRTTVVGGVVVALAAASIVVVAMPRTPPPAPATTESATVAIASSPPPSPSATTSEPARPRVESVPPITAGTTMITTPATRRPVRPPAPKTAAPPPSSKGVARSPGF